MCSAPPRTGFCRGERQSFGSHCRGGDAGRRIGGAGRYAEQRRETNEFATIDLPPTQLIEYLRKQGMFSFTARIQLRAHCHLLGCRHHDLHSISITCKASLDRGGISG